MLYIGLISGTSMDGIDAALVDFSDDGHKLVDYQQQPLTSELRKELKAINKNSPIDQVSKLDVQLGELFADASLGLIKQNGIAVGKVSAIGSHGQTVLHRPEKPYPGTLQIGDGNIIACRTGITTVTDFRRMDLAAGGQGAPLAPVFHNFAFRHKSKHRIVLNLGGMANVTLLPSHESNDDIIGFDTGPANVLLDDWINTHTGEAYDKDGNWAGSGEVNETLLKILLDDNYLKQATPKSTGRDYFNPEWLQRKLSQLETQPPAVDVQATLLELTAVSIADAVKHSKFTVDELIVCGGGAHNRYLLQRLGTNLPGPEISSTEAFGISPDAVEAVTFAWLAMRRIQHLPGNLPSVTGADSERILGAVYEAG
ncbi:MAG TPA: anhydro-N-acetylmuramic acid kinase [Gammaproteobacteria bacterium]